MHHHGIAHNEALVVLSFAVAYFASFTALDMGTRLRKAVGRTRNVWLSGSAIVLGGGIWSMHFVAMLALHAGVPVAYDFGLTALSLIVAIAIVAVGFHVVTRPSPSIARQVGAGAIVGCGVAVMHYTGMAAMILPGHIAYDYLLVGVSIVIAIVAATAALWLTLNLTLLWHRAAAAGVMAIAVCGMHYTAMAATSIVVTPGSHAPIDPMSQTMLAVGVATAVFMILCLAMVCVFVDRRLELVAEREAQALRQANARLEREIEERKVIARELEAANGALASSRDAVRNLLDNADQGFLTIGPALIVEAPCSAACTALLGRAPMNKPIVSLLCEDAASAENVKATLSSVFRSTDDFIRQLKIDLLPTAFTLGEKSLRVGYKFLDNSRLMLILTDVTRTAELAATVERERERLEMIVFAVTKKDTLAPLVEDYENFLNHDLPELVERCETTVPSGELYRHLHTYKGLLAQFSFHWSPQSLHAFESRLEEVAGRPQQARVELKLDRLRESLQRDLAIITDALGGAAPIAGADEAARTAAHTAQAILASDEGRRASPRLRGLLQSLADSGLVDARLMLNLHCRGVAGLAARLGKKVAEVRAEGDDVRLCPRRCGPFFRALVHVFRNAVDHGVETPEQRLAAGKPEEAAITCRVTELGYWTEIAIRDDGAGIDRARLHRKLAPDERAAATRLPLEAIVFRAGLSSRDTVTDISGRGFGLAAVKHELDQIGGKVSVESTLGAGTVFRFRIPVAMSPLAADSPHSVERAAL